MRHGCPSASALAIASSLVRPTYASAPFELASPASVVAVALPPLSRDETVELPSPPQAAVATTTASTTVVSRARGPMRGHYWRERHGRGAALDHEGLGPGHGAPCPERVVFALASPAAGS